MKSFEIQRQEGTKWVHHAFYDDAQLALADAERLAQNERYHGVRVIEEEFTDNSDTSKSKYIFTSTGKGGSKVLPGGKSAKTATPAGQADPALLRSSVRPAGAKTASGKSPYTPLIFLAVILALGGAALLAMRIMLEGA